MDENIPLEGVSVGEQKEACSVREVWVARTFYLPSGIKQFAAGKCFCSLTEHQEIDDKATRIKRAALDKELARTKSDARAGREPYQLAAKKHLEIIDTDTDLVRTVVSDLKLKRPMALGMFTYASGLKLVEETIESRVAERFPRGAQPAREIFPAGDRRQEAFLSQGAGLTLAVINEDFVYINVGGALAEDLALACVFRANKSWGITPQEFLTRAGILMDSSEFSPVVVKEGFWGRRKVIDKDAFLLHQREILTKAESIAAGV